MIRCWERSHSVSQFGRKIPGCCVTFDGTAACVTPHSSEEPQSTLWFAELDWVDAFPGLWSVPYLEYLLPRPQEKSDNKCPLWRS